MEPQSQTGRQLKSQKHAPGVAAVYESQIQSVYSLLSLYLSEPALTEIVHRFANHLARDFSGADYGKYRNLLCLRLAHQELLKHPSAKNPEPHASLSREDSVSLCLRDLFGLSCTDVAAVALTSEGSIRTRLKNARKRLPEQQSATSPEAGHQCVFFEEKLEDAQPPFPETSCPACRSFAQRRTASMEQLKALPLRTVPEKLQHFHETPILVKEGSRWVLNWSSAPWYFKALFEGMLATCLVLGIVLSIPRIKQIYEFWLERRLDLYTIAELTSQVSTEESQGPAEAHPQNGLKVASAAAEGQEAASEDADEEEGDDTETAGNAPPRIAEKISSDNTYRFIIKTDGPDAMKPSILKILGKYESTPIDKENANGVELPGGILLNVYIPIKAYKGLHNEIYGLAGRDNVKIGSARSRERGITGKVHVKIWLQRS